MSTQHHNSYFRLFVIMQKDKKYLIVDIAEKERKIQYQLCIIKTRKNMVLLVLMFLHRQQRPVLS